GDVRAALDRAPRDRQAGAAAARHAQHAAPLRPREPQQQDARTKGFHALRAQRQGDLRKDRRGRAADHHRQALRGSLALRRGWSLTPSFPNSVWERNTTNARSNDARSTTKQRGRPAVPDRARPNTPGETTVSEDGP